MNSSPQFDYKTYLAGLVDFERSRSADYTATKPNLVPLKQFLANLGDPQLSYPTIIIAGSKGKGTTATYLEHLLRESGYSTGVYLSPHVIDYPERIRINVSDISPQQLSFGLEWVAFQSEKHCYTPSVFEALTVCAFELFRRESVDVSILEVGLGGRLDATNTANPCIAIITTILLEHTSVLGSTLSQIASEKAGVIRQGARVFSAPQEPEVSTVLEQRCREVGATIAFVDEKNVNLFSLLPEVLRTNAMLAVAAFQAFSGKLPDTSSLPQVMGRYQSVKVADTQMLLDAAHTPASIRALLKNFSKTVPSFSVVFGALNDKNYHGMLEEIAQYSAAKEIMFIHMKDCRAVEPQELDGLWRTISEKKSTTISEDDLKSVFSSSVPLLVTGSFRVVREALLCLRGMDEG